MKQFSYRQYQQNKAIRTLGDIQKLFGIEDNDEAPIDDFLNEVDAKTLALFVQANPGFTHDWDNRNGIINETCHKCGGQGEHQCPYCQGEGVKSNGRTCKPCGGVGEVDCHPCEGRGYFTYDVYQLDDHPDFRDSLRECQLRAQAVIDERQAKEYEHAIETVLDRYLPLVYLDFERVHIRAEVSGRWLEGVKLKPIGDKTWADVASKLLSIADGIGIAYVPRMSEFLEYGPFVSYKEGAIAHLGWLRSHNEVFGWPKLPEAIFMEALNAR